MGQLQTMNKQQQNHGLQNNAYSISKSCFYIFILQLLVKQITEYGNHVPQSKTADHPQHREEETGTTDSHNTIKVKQPALSLSAR